ncbi:MAG: plastocyanin/azurin family copper-binding protein [Halobacteriaceae archaeon]
MGIHRRRLLAAAAAGAAALAGCGGTGGSGDDAATPTRTVTETATAADATATPTGSAGTTAEGTVETTAEETATQTATESDLPRVELENTSFNPIRKAVAVGETVEWVNRDSLPHDVTSARFHDSAADWSFETDTFLKGETVTYTFESAGVYEYYCSVHGESAMCGAVLVGDVSLDASLPCE